MKTKTNEATYGTEIKFYFPGTREELEDAQELFHRKLARRERSIWMRNCNSLRGIRYHLWKKFKDAPVTVLDILKTIWDKGHLDDGFLQDAFELTVNDVRRAVRLGIVPPSIKDSLSRYFVLKD